MRLSIFLSVLLVTVVLVQAAPKPHNGHKPSPTTAEGAKSTEAGSTKASATTPEAHAKIQEELNSRRARMMNYFGYYPYYGATLNQPQAPAFVAPYPPQLNDFYQFPYGTIAPVYSYNSLLGVDGEDSFEAADDQQTHSSLAADSNELDYDEDMFSRANRRRPGKGNANRNSPIFYIRLPPTPYMFIRGLGYISNPPTIQPLPAPVNPFTNYQPSPYQNPYMSMPAANPYMQQQPSPFINVPVNYMSNAKPVGVYQYPGAYQPPTGAAAAAAAAGMRFPISGFGTNHVNPVRQRPAYASSAGAQSAAAASGPAFNNPDSKITHLKGPFIFNGRPEDIYLLQNLQTTPYNANFFHGYY